MRNTDGNYDIGSAAAEKFRTRLLQWHHEQNNRSLPWKGVKDPYKIWLSEVILQQTRAAQGLPYYLKFIERWPNITVLASAEDEEVFRTWQGLGYYSRCKNMLATARLVAEKYNGIFPNTYEQIIGLKGIGAYTAAAIASFAFDLPHAVVDGNVYRVLSRYLGIPESIDSTQGKKVFAHVAHQMLSVDESSAYNQAIMDLGATVCVPAKPSCDLCPLQANCFANRKNVISDLPVRTKKVIVKNRYFQYIILECNGEIWVNKREAGDIWENLYEPYLIEHAEPFPKEWIKNILILNEFNNSNIDYMGSEKQRLTHQLIHFVFFRVRLAEKIPIVHGNWVSTSQLEKLAFPKTVVSFFRKNLYF